MAYKKRLTLLALIDSIIVLSAICISYLMLHPYFGIFNLTTLLFSSITLLISHHTFASMYKLYKKSWKYASIRELISIVKAVSLSVLTVSIMQLLVFNDIYVRALVLTWILHISLISSSRLSWRILSNQFKKEQMDKKNTLVIGAGSAGTMVVRQLLNNQDNELKPVAFIDDDSRKHKLDILGVPVVGNSQEILNIVKAYEIENIVIAIPSLNKTKLKHIFNECLKTNVKTQIMPKIEDIMLGKVKVNQFRDVEVEDLLGREPVKLDIDIIAEYVSGKIILVTGAGGSIGSEICRQVCKFSPEKLILLGHGENSIYQIDLELKKIYDNQIEIIPVIADIQDKERIFEVIGNYKPNVVYHAAAHKHVPLMEYNPREAMKNNIIGTKNVADAADTYGVNTFVMISSDKAVNPTNVMGATKRVAEMLVQQLDRSSRTRFVAVRFGNVLGSRGSVIPLFKKQIQAGGPVTVTHPEMTRYFMTIPEASRLVIQAGALAKGGEIFVLDMGEPVKIVDLARNLINLSGYSPEEIEIKFSGIRPGEKMYEELLNENEVHSKHIFPKIHIGKANSIDSDMLYKLIESLHNMSDLELHDTLIDVANNKQNLTLKAHVTN
ncbi:polysaccharide biosynthesis protein [Priestia aryabhattai]|uniref:polysaccharide biosynthesis protein n=1 Tax=Priestia TaxID=2800373 RepID=UPI00263B4B3E|nr:nucleoside-diphosphate sugar epimerase/dehydratase [Priestia megaterium]MDN4861144.1 nucleoside-diphosphate sugar epimerase/dehydratase [Priestia megaterium]